MTPWDGHTAHQNLGVMFSFSAAAPGSVGVMFFLGGSQGGREGVMFLILPAGGWAGRRRGIP